MTRTRGPTTPPQPGLQPAAQSRARGAPEDDATPSGVQEASPASPALQTGASGAAQGVDALGGPDLRGAGGAGALGRVELGGVRDVAEHDLRIFNRMLRGELPVEEGMRLVAHSGGWPIRTAHGFLFAAPAGDRARLSLASEHGGWRPEAMKKDGALFHATLPAGRDRVLRYKLVEADGTYRADPWARAYGYDDHGEYSLTRAPARPHLERWPALGDGVVAPRDVRVFVPAERPTHFLYVHDGQNLFDPGAPHGGWRLQHATGPHTLAIGIDNTPERRSEYTHTRDFAQGGWVEPKGDAYTTFVEETVRPFIEARYGAPKKVALMGSSLGGLVSLYGAIRYPESYDFVASLSGTLGWGKLGKEQGANGPTMADLFAQRPKTKTTFYLDSGGAPNGRDNYDSNRATADAIAGLGYAWDRELFHWHEPGALHTESAWAKRVHRPLAVFEAM